VKLNSTRRETFAVILAAATVLTAGKPAEARSSVTTTVRMPYLLLNGSHLLDDCPPCARPTVLEPMRGRFELRLVEENPLFSRYDLTNIAFTAGSLAGPTYKVAGRGSYTLGGEVALLQDMFLEVQIDDGVTNRVCYLTNATPTLSRRWPLLDVELVQTNGTFTQVYHLHLLAAPVRDLSFSTVNAFTSSHWNPPTNHVSPGDLLSFRGRVQRRNGELTAQLEFCLPFPIRP
jgi:hypothetical protein